MTDLDTRIRSYASGWADIQDGPPDFDAALDRAVAAPRRHVTWAWSGLAAACVLALALIVGLTSQGGPSGPRPAGGPGGTAVSSPEQTVSLDRRAAEQSLAEQAQRSAYEAYALGRLAMRQAQANHWPDASGTAVRTTRQQALAATDPGAGGPDDQVWLLQLTGHFRCDSCTVAPGAPAPTGRYLTMIVSTPFQYEGDDVRVSDSPVDLSTLGTTMVTLFP